MADRTYTVKPNQTIGDIVLMNYGTIEARMDFCRINDISPTDIPDVGTVLQAPLTMPDGTLLAYDANVVNYFAKKKMVLGTANVIHVPLALLVVLKPRMGMTPSISGLPHTLGYYLYQLAATEDFINVNALLDSYLTTNNVIYETEERLVTGHSSENTDQLSVTAMTAKSIPYKLNWTVGFGYMMVWSDLAPDAPTVTYKDVEGNQATFAPVLILDNITENLILMLMSDITVELVSSTSALARVRVTRSHPSSFIPDFAMHAMHWIADASDGEPDPDDPDNPDKVILNLPKGNYTLGVKTTYTFPSGFGHDGFAFPSSVFTMVIQIG